MWEFHSPTGSDAGLKTGAPGLGGIAPSPSCAAPRGRWHVGVSLPCGERCRSEDRRSWRHFKPVSVRRWRTGESRRDSLSRGARRHGLPPPPRLVEETSGDPRVFDREVAMAVHDLLSEFPLRRFDRAAQEPGPGDGAHYHRLVGIRGLQESSLSRSSVQHANQEASAARPRYGSLYGAPRTSRRSSGAPAPPGRGRCQRRGNMST